MTSRTRICRRRGRNRKLKYTWKSAGHPTVRKSLCDGKQWYTQYTPCGCQQMCGKDCPCVENGTCCEKYCGCVPKPAYFCLRSSVINVNMLIFF
jgi:[histone H3]-lysine27 N-trimethyltransferase EZH2